MLGANRGVSRITVFLYWYEFCYVGYRLTVSVGWSVYPSSPSPRNGSWSMARHGPSSPYGTVRSEVKLRMSLGDGSDSPASA